MKNFNLLSDLKDDTFYFTNLKRQKQNLQNFTFMSAQAIKWGQYFIAYNYSKTSTHII